MIYYKTDNQASIINNPENWNNFENLSTIFKKQKEWSEYIKIYKVENEKRLHAKIKIILVSIYL